MMKEKILITGSEGFIGKYLVNFLHKKNFDIVRFDLQSGKNLLVKKHLHEALLGVNYIIHLAAVGDVYIAERNPNKTLKVGVLGTLNLIQTANKYPIKKIIYASTWEVYGKPKYQPIDEFHPCNPDHPYSIAKYAGELIFKSYLNKLPWIILRLGSAYGYNMRINAVIPAFITNAMKQKKIQIQGFGNQFRQFTHIDDICDAFYKALTISVKNETFNIVSTKKTTIRELANFIEKIIPAKITYTKSREGDVKSAHISNKKAEKIIGWKQKKHIQMEIPSIIRYMCNI